MLITFNLIALFIKTRHVLKTSQLSLTKGPWIHGLQNIFQSDKQVLLHRQSSDCTPLWCSFTWLPSHYSLLSTISCQWVIPVHALNSHSLIALPCVVAHCELIPSYHCWHQLFLPLASGFLKHSSSFAFPFLAFLQRLQVLFLPARPKLIGNVLDTSLMFSIIYIYIRFGKFSWWWWNYLWFHGYDIHRWKGL